MGANKVQKEKCGSDVKLRRLVVLFSMVLRQLLKTILSEQLNAGECRENSVTRVTPRMASAHETKKGSKNKEKVIQQLRNQRGH